VTAPGVEPVGVPTGMGDTRGVALGDHDRLGVGLAEAGKGVVAEGLGCNVAVAAGVAEAITRGLDCGVAAGAADDDALGTAWGRTNRLGGASGGGVASAWILARARSTADRSAMAFQPVSTIACVRVSRMRGRSIPGTRPITGAGISIISPRTTGRAGSSPVRVRRSRR
jgi:hypothetical protein